MVGFFLPSPPPFLLLLLFIPVLLFLLLPEPNNTLVSCSLISFLEAAWSISRSHKSPSSKSLAFLLWSPRPSGLLVWFCPQASAVAESHPAHRYFHCSISVSPGLQGQPARSFQRHGRPSSAPHLCLSEWRPLAPPENVAWWMGAGSSGLF